MEKGQIISLVKWIIALIMIVILCLMVLYLFTDLFKDDIPDNDIENQDIYYSIPTQNIIPLQDDIIETEIEEIEIINRGEIIEDERAGLIDLILERERKKQLKMRENINDN